MATSALPTTMTGISYPAYGDSSVLELSDTLPVPELGPTDVLIKVSHAGVNPVDYKIRGGLIPFIKAWPTAFPVVPGWDVAGTVVATGSKTTRLAVGDAVYSYCRPAFDMEEAHPGSAGEKIDSATGGYAQYAVVKEWKVAKAPAALSAAEAAGLPLAALTAYQGLFTHGALAEGQTVLVLNASGGVGSYAVQLAKAHGATVIGTTSARNAEYVTGLGADRTVDYNVAGGVAGALVGTHIDLVYDCVGGDATTEGVKVVADGGAVISIANGFALAGLIEAHRPGAGVTGAGYLVQPSSEQLDELAAMADKGTLRSPPVTTLPLADAAKAMDSSASGRTRGKLVLVVDAVVEEE